MTVSNINFTNQENRLTNHFVMPSDHRSCVEKCTYKVLSFIREIFYGLSSVYNRIFQTDSYNLCGQNTNWKKDSIGLCVLIHGLRGHPSIWRSQKQLLKSHTKIDTFVPFVPKKGDCSLEEAARPILSTILDYIAKHPGKPICLIGVSNGSRLSTWIETELRQRDPRVSVKVSTIAGVHLGSSVINRLESFGIAGCFLKPVIRRELAYNSEKAKELLSRVKAYWPSGFGVGERAYEFYASMDDCQVPDLDSSLPIINKGEQFHVVSGQGHNSIVAAVAKEQIASCVNWIHSYSKSQELTVPFRLMR